MKANNDNEMGGKKKSITTETAELFDLNEWMEMNEWDAGYRWIEIVNTK